MYKEKILMMRTEYWKINEHLCRNSLARRFKIKNDVKNLNGSERKLKLIYL